MIRCLHKGIFMSLLCRSRISPIKASALRAVEASKTLCEVAPVPISSVPHSMRHHCKLFNERRGVIV